MQGFQVRPERERGGADITRGAAVGLCDVFIVPPATPPLPLHAKRRTEREGTEWDGAAQGRLVGTPQGCWRAAAYSSGWRLLSQEGTHAGGTLPRPPTADRIARCRSVVLTRNWSLSDFFFSTVFCGPFFCDDGLDSIRFLWQHFTYRRGASRLDWFGFRGTGGRTRSILVFCILRIVRPR